MKAPVAIDESVKVPLSPKVANTVKAIEKVTDTQLALLLLRQVNSNFPHIHTEDITLNNKGDCCRVDKRCAHLYCITPEVCD